MLFLNPYVVFTFSKAIDPTTLKGSNIAAYGPGGYISVMIHRPAGGTQVAVTFSASPGTLITLLVTPGVARFSRKSRSALSDHRAHERQAFIDGRGGCVATPGHTIVHQRAPEYRPDSFVQRAGGSRIGGTGALGYGQWHFGFGHRGLVAGFHGADVSFVLAVSVSSTVALRSSIRPRTPLGMTCLTAPSAIRFDADVSPAFTAAAPIMTLKVLASNLSPRSSLAAGCGD